MNGSADNEERDHAAAARAGDDPREDQGEPGAHQTQPRSAAPRFERHRGLTFALVTLLHLLISPLWILQFSLVYSRFFSCITTFTPVNSPFYIVG